MEFNRHSVLIINGKEQSKEQIEAFYTATEALWNDYNALCTEYEELKKILADNIGVKISELRAEKASLEQGVSYV